MYVLRKEKKKNSSDWWRTNNWFEKRRRRRIDIYNVYRIVKKNKWLLFSIFLRVLVHSMPKNLILWHTRAHAHHFVWLSLRVQSSVQSETTKMFIDETLTNSNRMTDKNRLPIIRAMTSYDLKYLEAIKRYCFVWNRNLSVYVCVWKEKWLSIARISFITWLYSTMHEEIIIST